MNKEEFIAELKDGLSGLPQNDIDERVLFYTEMIDDRMEEGMSEEEAISGMHCLVFLSLYNSTFRKP